MATSVNQLTRIGGFFSGVAKKLTILAKAAGVVPNPASFAVQSLITDTGTSARGLISTSGLSVSGEINNSFAVQSLITSDGTSARAIIDTSGISVQGKMEG